jgi:hypothetical protein
VATKNINEDAPTCAVGDGTKVAGMSANDVGVKKNKKILTFKQMLNRKVTNATG